MTASPQIVVIGLGYVGLPLAIALARKFDVTGFDIDVGRIEELRGSYDRTLEVAADDLATSSLVLTTDAMTCAGGDLFIVTVPTPVDESNRPDLSAVLSATRMVAGLIDPARRPIIVYESTVYPGVTEDICGPEIERVSALTRGRDFRLGYSPERINPGDRSHTIDRITKVIAGEDVDVLDRLDQVYGAINQGNVFRAASIKVAEAAKAIENAQRDINIAFVNEVAQIFSKIGVSIWDVLDASRTKWNFLPFEPGLVGGHCIGVDPYYLSHLAEEIGHDPRVILAGRSTNDGMGPWIADLLHAARPGPGTALIMGATFKENVPDLRNSQSIQVARRLEQLGHRVTIADPVVSAAELEREYGRNAGSPSDGPFDLVVIAVAHQAYREMGVDEYGALLAKGGTLADIKNILRDHPAARSLAPWTL